MRLASETKTKKMRKLAVAVAKDVISAISRQTRNPLIQVDGRDYMRITNGGHVRLFQKDFSKAVLLDAAQNVLTKRKVKDTMVCNTCAIGTMFVCHIMRHDGTRFGDFLLASRSEMGFRLSDAFTETELQAIESSFYDHPIRHYYVLDKNESSMRINEVHSLIRVCDNIIRNDGRFDYEEEELNWELHHENNPCPMLNLTSFLMEVEGEAHCDVCETAFYDSEAAYGMEHDNGEITWYCEQHRVL